MGYSLRFGDLPQKIRSKRHVVRVYGLGLTVAYVLGFGVQRFGLYGLGVLVCLGFMVLAAASAFTLLVARRE